MENGIYDSEVWSHVASLKPALDGLASFGTNSLGEIVSWDGHAKDMFGYEESEVEHRQFYFLFDKSDAKLIKTIITCGTEESTVNVTVITKSKQSLCCRVGLRRLNNISGESIGYMCMIRDKTDENSLRERLEHINGMLEAANSKIDYQNGYIKDLESFNSVLVHDLKAPLRAILGYSNILIEELGEGIDGEILRMINAIAENGNQATILLEGLVGINRISRKEISKEEVNTKQLLEAVISNAVLSSSKKIEYSIGDLPIIKADPDMLKTLFVEIIDNAIKFSNKTGLMIEVTSMTKNDSVTISIKDNGHGFDMNYAIKIFQLFQRLVIKGNKGLGAGLAIAQKIAEKHHGQITCKSIPEKGSTFYVTLPVG